MTRRTDRINGILRQEISQLVSRDLNDPRLSGLVTITRVETSEDLHYAKVFVSIMGDREAKDTALQGMGSASGFIRRELRSRLTLKQVPELTYYLDESLDEAEHILKLMDKVGDGPSPQMT
jgi:ribosome-binding factor A